MAGYRVEGKVTRVAMSMNPMTKSFDAIVEFNNSQSKIKAGITADIYILEEGEESIVIERKNIMKEGNEHYVFLAVDGQAAKRNIKINESNDVKVVANRC